VKYPRFVGDGYLALSPVRRRFDQLTATIVCRPETNNGLLLLNSDSVDAKQDFFSVALVDGRAVLTYVIYHHPTRSVTVVSNSRIFLITSAKNVMFYVFFCLSKKLKKLTNFDEFFWRLGMCD